MSSLLSLLPSSDRKAALVAVTAAQAQTQNKTSANSAQFLADALAALPPSQSKSNPKRRDLSLNSSTPSAQSTASQASSTALVTTARSEAILRQFHSSDTLIQASLADIQGHVVPAAVLPTAAQEAAELERTKAALSALASAKLGAQKASAAVSSRAPESTIVRYTPLDSSSAVPERLIKIQERPVDPLEFARVKVKENKPLALVTAPVPVLSDPASKLTVEDQRAWHIPASVSQWKNPKGFTIEIDKRLAASAKDLHSIVPSENHAKFAEAMWAAEQLAQEEIERKNEEKRVQEKREKEKIENELRTAAEAAIHANQRRQRDSEAYSFAAAAASSTTAPPSVSAPRPSASQFFNSSSSVPAPAPMSSRDASERVALGHLPGQTPKDFSSMFDQRLFNRADGLGANSRFHDEDSYAIYDKPLFQPSSADALYRPTRSNAMTNAQQGDGDEESASASNAGRARGNRPVEFEREDPLGFNQMLQQAKERAAAKAADAESSAAAPGDRRARGEEPDEGSQKRRRTEE